MLRLRAGLLLATGVAAGWATDGPIRGFTGQSSEAERQVEAKFQAIPQPDSMREAMRFLSGRPHHLGSARDSVNADWILQRFRSWGVDAPLQNFSVFFPPPPA